MYRFIAVSASVLALAGTAGANEFTAELNALAESELSSWITEPMILDAVREQNAAHAGIGQDQIDALDQDWRAQVGSAASPLIDGLIARPASGWLNSRKLEHKGLVTEVFVTDAHGLNVAQSDVTSDYWQGDEAKWSHPFQTGEVHLGDVEFDESTQTFQAQVSLPVVDPESNEVIGAATFGINLEMLQ